MFLGMIFFLLITSLIPEPDMSSLYSTENEQDAQSIDEKRIFPLDEYLLNREENELENDDNWSLCCHWHQV